MYWSDGTSMFTWMIHKFYRNKKIFEHIWIHINNNRADINWEFGTMQKIDLKKNLSCVIGILRNSCHIFIESKMQTFDFTYTQRIMHSSSFDIYWCIILNIYTKKANPKYVYSESLCLTSDIIPFLDLESLTPKAYIFIYKVCPTNFKSFILRESFLDSYLL